MVGFPAKRSHRVDVQAIVRSRPGAMVVETFRTLVMKVIRTAQ